MHYCDHVLSVVIPMYNEEDVLGQTLPRVRSVLDGMNIQYEVVAVDDGSKDQTAAMIDAARGWWPQLRLVRLRRNAGHQAALTAGLHRAFGDYVITMDADLQDPPEVIPRMLAAAIDEDVDVVYGVRDDRSTDPLIKRTLADIYYRLMRAMAGDQVNAHAGDFRLISRSVVETVNELPEKHRVYRMLVPWLGFPSTTVTYDREVRAAGVTKYPVSKSARLAMDSIASFSGSPLRLATYLGAGGFVVCVVLLVTTVILELVGATVPGWASLSVLMFFLGAVQLLCLGLLGEYVGRLFQETQRRPLYYLADDSADSSGTDAGRRRERAQTHRA